MKATSRFSTISNTDLTADPHEEAALGGRPVLGAILGTIPGVILWILITYLDFGAGIMGFIIVAGSLLAYKKQKGEVTRMGLYGCLIISLFMIVLTTASIEASSLRNEYTKEFKKNKEPLTKSFLEKAKNNGRSEKEIDVYLKEKFGINGISDTKGIESLVKKIYDSSYIENLDLANAPDSFLRSYSALFGYLDGSSEQAKTFLTNIIVGFAFSILAFAALTNSTFIYPIEKI